MSTGPRDIINTHQIQRALEECAPVLRTHFKILAEYPVSDVTRQNHHDFLGRLEADFGASLAVPTLAFGQHRYMHPEEEALQQMGNDPSRVIGGLSSIPDIAASQVIKKVTGSTKPS